MSMLHPNKTLIQRLDALQRLWKIANGYSGQCKIVARFLLNLYNGARFPFDMTDFRALDTEIFRDCLQVLALDKSPMYEVHVWLEKHGEKDIDFEKLAREWNFRSMDGENWRDIEHG